MKKIFLVACIIAGALMLSGCSYKDGKLVGKYTGHEYTLKDAEVVYKVVKKGVVTFMTKDEIEQARLDDVDVVVTDAYKRYKGNDNNATSD